MANTIIDLVDSYVVLAYGISEKQQLLGNQYIRVSVNVNIVAVPLQLHKIEQQQLMQ